MSERISWNGRELLVDAAYSWRSGYLLPRVSLHVDGRPLGALTLLAPRRTLNTHVEHEGVPVPLTLEVRDAYLGLAPWKEFRLCMDGVPAASGRVRTRGFRRALALVFALALILAAAGAAAIISAKELPPLFAMAAVNSPKGIQLFLQAGFDPDDERGYPPPLFHAALHGYGDVVEVLLGAGAEARGTAAELGSRAAARPFFDVRPPLLAAAPGNITLANLLSESGALRARPLLAAALTGRAEIANRLLDAGDDPNARSEHGLTPLMFAALGGHTAIVKQLLERGAIVNAATAQGHSVLFLAAAEGHAETVVALLAAGADPNRKAEDGRAPLHVAILHGQSAAAQRLLEGGADPRLSIRHKNTPLHLAAGRGNTAVIGLLLAKGAHIDAQNSEGLTPLHAACRNNQAPAAAVLLKHGAHIDACDHEARTPLDYAKAAQAAALITLLSEHGALTAPPCGPVTPGG